MYPMCCTEAEKNSYLCSTKEKATKHAAMPL